MIQAYRPFENRTKFPVFEWDLKFGPFRNRSTFDHSKTEQVRFSDPHCIKKAESYYFVQDLQIICVFY